jgi:hypothetical protein
MYTFSSNTPTAGFMDFPQRLMFPALDQLRQDPLFGEYLLHCYRQTLLANGIVKSHFNTFVLSNFP